jgi:predicted aspartyl protease
MHTPRRWSPASLLCCLFVLPSPSSAGDHRLGGPDAPAPVPVRLAGFLPIVPVQVAGAGVLEFAVDTGATTTIIDGEVARAMGLEPVARSPVVTAAAREPVTRVRLDSLVIGGLRVSGLDILAIDLTPLREVDRRIAGVLGQDVLGRQNYLIAYSPPRLWLDPTGRLGDSLKGPRVPFRTADSRLLLRVSGSGRSIELALDSGSEACVLFERSPGALDWVRRGHWRQETLGTALGVVAASAGRLVPVRLGDLLLDDLRGAIVPADVRAGRIEDGLLPLIALGAVYVDSRHGLLVLPERLPR